MNRKRIERTWTRSKLEYPYGIAKSGAEGDLELAECKANDEWFK